MSRCQERAPRHGFRFKNKLYSVDASTIDLCLSVFPWASFRRTKAAIKLHVGLDHAGHLPSFVRVTDGKTADVTAARIWEFPAGSVVVADRAYLDFKWFHQLQARGVTFVTRLKRGVRYRVTAGTVTEVANATQSPPCKATNDPEVVLRRAVPCRRDYLERAPSRARACRVVVFRGVCSHLQLTEPSVRRDLERRL